MFEFIITFAKTHPSLGMATAFFLAMLESLPLVGSMLPGMATMPPIGWLIATSVLPAKKTLFLIFLGGMIGDYIGYIIGFNCKSSLKTYAKKYNKKSWVTKGEKFVEKYGVLSIVIGRFIGPFRSSIPLFAGVLNMNKKYFILAAIPSVLLWEIAHLAPGIALALFNEDILSGYYVIQFFLILSFLLSLTIALYHEKASLALWKLQNALKPKYFNLSLNTIQKSCSLIFFSFTLFILLIGLLFGYFQDINTFLYQQTSYIKTPFFINIALIQTSLCYIPALTLLTVSLSSYLFFKGYKNVACQFVIPFFLTMTFIFMLKNIISYPRPEAIAHLLGNQSLPSGHSGLIASFLFSLVLVWPDNSQKQNISIAASAFIALSMFSRVYLGAHWLTDVIAALLIACITYHITFNIKYISHNNSNINELVKIICNFLIIYPFLSIPLAYSLNLLNSTPYLS